MSYLDDALVFGKTLEEHNQNLTDILTQIKGMGLGLKPRKCKFAQLSVEYLGHVVAEAGIHTNPQKVQMVQQFPVPTDVRVLRSLLGLASYYWQLFESGWATVYPDKKESAICVEL